MPDQKGKNRDSEILHGKSLNYSGVQVSLKKAMKDFNKISSRRERLIRESRTVISLSSKAIVSVHVSDFSGAEKLKMNAKQRLGDLQKIARPDLVRYLTVPEQEYVECSALYAIATNSMIPSIQDLEVTDSSYVLGLLDAIGELKRAVLNNVRKSYFRKSEEIFSIMEKLYLLISPFAIYDNIAQGIKRKLDVARSITEDVRAIVTEEKRRQDLMDKINRLSIELNSAEKQPVQTRKSSR